VGAAATGGVGRGVGRSAAARGSLPSRLARGWEKVALSGAGRRLTFEAGGTNPQLCGSVRWRVRGLVGAGDQTGVRARCAAFVFGELHWRGAVERVSNSPRSEGSALGPRGLGRGRERSGGDLDLE